MNCLHCSKPVLGKYCSTPCQHKAQDARKRVAFLNGEYVGRHLQFRTGEWSRRFLIDLFSYKCNSCGISEWSNQPITLEVNHKDGEPTNNSVDNLEFLCPNCHSQTPNFRALNKKSSRTHRKTKPL